MIRIFGKVFGIDIEINDKWIYFGISLGVTFYTEFYYEKVWPYTQVETTVLSKSLRWQYGSLGIIW